MILADLRNYLQARPGATLAELARHFGADAETLRGMLALWIRKGKVQKLLASSSCGSRCTQCDPASVEIYQWTAEVTPPLPPAKAPCRG